MKFHTCLRIAIFLLAITCRAQVERATSPEELVQGKGHVVPVLNERMSAGKLEKFLERRVSGQFLGDSTAYMSLLYAVLQVPIWSDEKDIEHLELENWYPESYRPTLREHLDVLARQLKCTWRYDFTTGYFVFKHGVAPYPYSIELPKRWKIRDQGQCIAYIPPTAPAGLDVYILGQVTAETEAQEDKLKIAVRDYVATHMAANFSPELKNSDFTEVPVAGVRARYYELSMPKKEGGTIIWRQWALVKNSWSVLIVSVISKDEEKVLLPQVRDMVESFDIKI